MARSTRNVGRAGSTLIEMLFALALLGTVLASLVTVGTTNSKLCETGVTNSNLEATARRALDRLSRELAGARAGSLETLAESPLWQDGFDFDCLSTMRADDGRITWSANRAEYRLETGEANDGLDNDGDGLADEGMLVLVQDAGGAEELELVLARGVREYLEGELPNGIDDNGNGLVDERGVAFERVDSDLRLHLTLQASGPDGRQVTRTLTTTVWSRN